MQQCGIIIEEKYAIYDFLYILLLGESNRNSNEGFSGRGKWHHR